jgi:hypothetical protein
VSKLPWQSFPYDVSAAEAAAKRLCDAWARAREAEARAAAAPRATEDERARVLSAYLYGRGWRVQDPGRRPRRWVSPDHKLALTQEHAFTLAEKEMGPHRCDEACGIYYEPGCPCWAGVGVPREVTP